MTVVALGVVALLIFIDLAILITVERYYAEWGNWDNAAQFYFQPTYTLYSKVTMGSWLLAAAGVIELLWWWSVPDSSLALEDAINGLTSGKFIRYAVYSVLYLMFAAQILSIIYTFVREDDASAFWLSVLSSFGVLALVIALKWLTIPALLIGGLVVGCLWGLTTRSKIAAIISDVKESEKYRKLLEEQRRREEEKERWMANLNSAAFLAREQKMFKNLGISSSPKARSGTHSASNQGNKAETKPKPRDYVHDDGYGNKHNTRYQSLHWTLRAQRWDCLYYNTTKCQLVGHGKCEYENNSQDCPYFRESGSYRHKVDRYLQNGTL